MTATLPARSSSVTDRQLVERVRDGDDAGFRALYERHVDSVTATCRGRVSHGDVDDVVQDAFIRAYERLDQLQDGNAFGGWVRAIAVRLSVDVHRRGARTIATDDFDDAAGTVEAADEVVVRREVAQELHAQLAGLGERDREALWLRDGLAVGISEVAERFDLTEGSTRVMLTRARRRLRATWAAVVAGLVAVRGLRGSFGRAPQMAAAAAAAVAVPVLLIPAIGGESAPVAPSPTRQITVEPAVVEPEPASIPSTGPVEIEGVADEPAPPPAPVAPVPVEPVTDEAPDPVDPPPPPVGIEQRPAPDDGQVGGTTIEDGDGTVANADIYSGELAEAVEEVVGVEGPSDDEGERDEDGGTSSEGPDDSAGTSCVLVVCSDGS